jgi:hypothetical protein
MKMELTVVRLKLTQEPVAVFEKQNCMVKLASLIDEVTTPSDCEYADYSADVDFAILFGSPMDKDWRDDETAVCDSARIGWGLLSEMEDIFSDPDIIWAEIPVFIDAIALRSDGLEILTKGDVF